MEGHFFNAIAALHEQLRDCCRQRTASGQIECAECQATCDALAALERIPRLRAISEGLEDALHKEPV
jgi:hypothetical protein